MQGRDWNPQPAKVPLTTADLHLAWDVPYEPGVLRAVGRRGGEVVCVQEIATAGPAAQIRLAADREEIAADGRDIAHITVSILDAEGRPAPTADNLVNFDVEGEGRLIGVDNGDPASHEPFQTMQRKAFNGLCLAIVQAGKRAGTVRVTARAEGLTGDRVSIAMRATG
jgi:beta-galactosidase